MAKAGTNIMNEPLAANALLPFGHQSPSLQRLTARRFPSISLVIPIVLLVYRLLYLFPPTRIKKLSDSCGKEWEAHYQCLEQHNQEFYRCRKPEKTLNQCVFEKLVGIDASPIPVQNLVSWAHSSLPFLWILVHYRNWPRTFPDRQKASRRFTKRRTRCWVDRPPTTSESVVD